MKRSLFAILFALVLAPPPAARAELGTTEETPAMLMNGRVQAAMRSRTTRPGTSAHAPSETTWVGYNPAYAGSNYWSIGVGHRRPRGTFGAGKADVVPVPDEDTGYWDWEHPVHGDSLQGWWPKRHNYTSFFISNLADHLRPWNAFDIGNTISYVINQGPGNRRTFGVSGAWHQDPGMGPQTLDAEQSDANPRPPRWTPIAGGMSAWCGLRAHGDLTRVDPVTGNPYNADALGNEVMAGSPTQQTGPGWTNYRFPGYASQWDQMLYRDVDIGGALDSAPVSVTFKYRTRMNTGKGTTSTTRTGWFDKDPLTVNAGNFISSTDAGLAAPIDSFMVYVGAPVADTAGAPWRGSDGNTHPVFDPVRRWFGELIRANDAGGHYQLFTTYGNDPPIAAPADSNAFATVTKTRNVTYGQLRAAWGDRIRLVFRVKTNRGFSDDDGSVLPSSVSGYLGAAQVDDVSIDLGSGPVALGGFEAESDIDNGAEVAAVDAWKTSSKPPAIYYHLHALEDLVYEDLCGTPGSPNRACNLAGNVISPGDHDNYERFNGQYATPEEEIFDGVLSPTITLAVDENNPTALNNMGLDLDTARPTAYFGMAYEIYTGGFDLFSRGAAWQPYAMAYPGTQADGTRQWTLFRTPRAQLFNPDNQCQSDWWSLDDFGQILTTNANGIPDSVRIGIRKLTQCWRFGLGIPCDPERGGYLDNISFAIVDASVKPLSAMIWDLFQDAFPANETAGLPGTAGFDTTTAIIQGGLNTAQLTGDLTRYIVAQDTLQVSAHGDSVEVQLVFRIRPGPGHSVVAGDPCSGLRRVPTDSTRISPGDGSFWTEYILNPGKDEDGFPTSGDCKGGGALRHDQRWSELTWCNARCDTAEQNLFPIQARALGGPAPGTYATMYHEDDKHLAALGISRHKCFLVDTMGAVNSSNITCSGVPGWVAAAKGYDGSPTTVEGTKILPDGLLTPGSHVQYFYVRKDLATGAVTLGPDTSVVYPQEAEASLDGHRWQQFSVLPDAWKFSSYGGLGGACMLYVDWNDSNGTERVWVSIADSIGATDASRRGAHNGWTGVPAGADVNDPAYFVSRNTQPGTTWDMYGVKAAKSFWLNSGSLGSRLAYRVPSGGPIDGKWARNAPTPEMLAAYYRILMILTGDLNINRVIGPNTDMSQDDTEIVRQFLTGATLGAHRGLYAQGTGFVEDLDINGNTTMMNLLGVSLRHPWYMQLSGNAAYCIDLIPTPIVTGNGDVYGLRNTCTTESPWPSTPDVLSPVGDAQAASYYDPGGPYPWQAPYVSSVFLDADADAKPPRHYQSLVDGWDIAALRSRLCDGSAGRLAYFWNVFNNVFGKICSVAGTPPLATDVPNNGEGRTFVNMAGVGNNPLRLGNAVIHLTLAKDDRVTVKIYDVRGRLVRTLANGQRFAAGRVDPALTWDGLDDGGRAVARGVYFANVRYERSRYEVARKMIVLK